MPRWLKISLKLIGGALLAIVLLWMGVALYINSNKKELLQKITKQLNNDINGNLTIESMSPELLRGFPGISISLKNVVLRDSLYPVHHHDLLQAKYVYVAINVFSILTKTPEIRNITISDAQVYLFSDSLGRSNTDLFKRTDKDTTRKKGKPHINDIFFDKVSVTYEHLKKHKLFQLDVHGMETVLEYNDSGWTARTNLEAFVKTFSFNTDKGSYMKNKELSLRLTYSYDKPKEIVHIPEQDIHVGDDKLHIGGTFFLSQSPTSFLLNISAQNILYKNAEDLLPLAVSTKLSIIDIKKPLNVQASIDGHMKYRDTPLVHISWAIKDNILVTPAGEVTDCSFTGMYLNQIVQSNDHTDNNSRIILNNFKASWQDIPFTVDTLTVSNLIRPVLDGRFRSHFPLTKLNPILGGEAFKLTNGNVDLNLEYKGGIMADDTTSPYVYGYMQVSGGNLTYLPRHLTFTNTSADIDFRGSDVFVNNVKLQTGNTSLQMNGSMRNFLNLYYADPAKIVLDWHIKSPRIDLNEFRSFLTARANTVTDSTAIVAKAKAKKAAVKKASNRLNDVLAVSSVHMALQVDRLLYKTFVADNINADIQLGQTGILLNNISLKEAGGKLTIHGNIDQASAINKFHVVADVADVRIQEFFSAFGNFGQTAITDKNIQGTLSANIDMNGSFKDDGQLLPKSFSGTVAFDLRDGALINFEPIQKIGKIIFRSRDLKNIAFKDLKDNLVVDGDKITINSLLIESSALNVQVRGVYALSKGTDMDIDVPLRNPKKDELIQNDSMNLQRDMRGLVIHLKATDGDDGNVKIKMMSQRQESKDSTGQPVQSFKKGFRKRLFGKKK